MTSATGWKISTMAALTAAAFFAVHPVRGSAAATANSHDATAAATGAAAVGGGLFGWMGGPSDVGASATAPHIGKQLEALRSARSRGQKCEALAALGGTADGDDEAVSAVADAADAKNTVAVRACAVRALGVLRSPHATSALIDLTGDREPKIRDLALSALAKKDDSAANQAVMAAAHADDHDTRIAALLAAGDAHLTGAGALIVQAIAGEDGATQACLIHALGNARDPDATPALLALSTDGPSETRAAALDALGYAGGAAATPTLTAALARGSAEESAAAARSLARIGDAGSRAALLEGARSDSRGVSSASLAALGELEGDDVRQVMIASLGSFDGAAANTAANYFAEHRDVAALGALSDVAGKGTADQVPGAVNAIAAIGGAQARDNLAALASRSGYAQAGALRALQTMPGGDAVARNLALELVKSKSGDGASAGVSALATDGSAEARDGLIAVAKRGGELSRQAVSALLVRGDSASSAAVADLASRARTPAQQAEALDALAASADPRQSPVFTAALRDKDARVRRAALSGLASLGGAEAERALLEASNRPDDASMRMLAVRSLGGVHTAAAASQLERFAHDQDPRLASAALRALANSAPDRAIAASDRAVQSSQIGLRRAAVQMTSALPADTARRILTTAVRDADASVASLAITHLTFVGGPEAERALLEVMTDRSSAAEVKQSAAAALDQMGGATARDNAALIDQLKDAPAADEPSDEGDEDDGRYDLVKG